MNEYLVFQTLLILILV